MNNEQLKLENQLCFPVYAASRLITRAYQPYLQALRITYPQYLVLMLLWEQDTQPVNTIAKKLVLNTNTITPLLKRMEQLCLIVRKRSETDERQVMISLTEKGQDLKQKASQIPQKMAEKLLKSNLNETDLLEMKKNLQAIICLLA
jgi:MarR family transcriptional regulator, organic hydroperoxide resistance regulator